MLIRAFASCTTSVYVNLSKNSFFSASRAVFETLSLTSAALDIAQVFTWLCARLHAVSRLAGAKVLLFSEPPKLFGDFFQFLCDFPAALDKCQVPKECTPYYILYRGEDITARSA